MFVYDPLNCTFGHAEITSTEAFVETSNTFLSHDLLDAIPTSTQ